MPMTQKLYVSAKSDQIAVVNNDVKCTGIRCGEKSSGLTLNKTKALWVSFLIMTLLFMVFQLHYLHLEKIFGVSND